MLEIGINYKEYLTKLKKEELVKIITIYNKLCDIFECEKISDTKSKKDILINKHSIKTIFFLSLYHLLTLNRVGGGD